MIERSPRAPVLRSIAFLRSAFLYSLTSAGCFSPLGPLATVHDLFPMIDKRVSWAAIPAPLDTILTNQSATG